MAKKGSKKAKVEQEKMTKSKASSNGLRIPVIPIFVTILAAICAFYVEVPYGKPAQSKTYSSTKFDRVVSKVVSETPRRRGAFPVRTTKLPESTMINNTNHCRSQTYL